MNVLRKNTVSPISMRALQRKQKSVLALIFCLSLVALPLAAELPPQVYRAEQDAAEEYIHLEALDVDLDWCFWCKDRAVQVRARVTQVQRSKIGLRVGQIITLRYRHKPLIDEVGPSAIPILEEGGQYPAYLNRIGVTKTTGIIFQPAAGGYSFREIKF